MIWNTGRLHVTNHPVSSVNSSRPTSATPPHLAAAIILVAVVMLVLAGCATSPKPAAPPQAPPVDMAREMPEPKPAPSTMPTAPGKPVRPVEKPVAAPVVPVTPEAPVRSKLSIRVESIPAGAMIVVDGKPVGRAPLDVSFEPGNNGFFKDPVTIRARFVATDAGGESFSVDERFGPLERIPLALVFSKDGAQRVIRQY